MNDYFDMSGILTELRDFLRGRSVELVEDTATQNEDNKKKISFKDLTNNVRYNLTLCEDKSSGSRIKFEILLTKQFSDESVTEILGSWEAPFYTNGREPSVYSSLYNPRHRPEREFLNKLRIKIESDNVDKTTILSALNEYLNTPEQATQPSANPERVTDAGENHNTSRD